MWNGQEEYEPMVHLLATVKDMARRHLEEVVAPADERFVLRYEGKESLLKLVMLQEMIMGCPVVLSLLSSFFIVFCLFLIIVHRI